MLIKGFILKRKSRQLPTYKLHPQFVEREENCTLRKMRRTLPATRKSRIVSKTKERIYADKRFILKQKKPAATYFPA